MTSLNPISPLLETFSRSNVRLTEKARQALVIAAEDALQCGYASIYDDSLLTGVLKAQTAAAHLVVQLGLDPVELSRDMFRLGPQPHDDLKDGVGAYVRGSQGYVPRTRYDLYSRRVNKPRYVRRRQKMTYFNSIGYQDEVSFELQGPPTVEESNLVPRELLEKDEVSSDDLFLATLRMPAAWRCLRASGLSVNKVRRHARLLGRIEPDIETQKLILTFEDGLYRIRLFDFLDIATIAHHREHPEKGISVYRANVLGSAEGRLQKEIEEFEFLINKAGVSEYEIQRYIEDHPDLLLGLEHRKLHSQLTLGRDDASSLRPDFFLERVDGALCDIADLKLPAARLVVGTHNRRTFSASMMSALGQLSEYSRYFDDSANRKAFYGRYGLQAYKPQISVVIGRSNEFASPLERSALEGELAQLKLLTYDDLLNRARRRLDFLRS